VTARPVWAAGTQGSLTDRERRLLPCRRNDLTYCGHRDFRQKAKA
jgi:hypothetical protein